MADCILRLGLAFLMVTCCLAKQIEVPALKDQSSLDIKIGRMQQANFPDFEFSSLYSRKVYKPVNNELVEFESCK